MDEPADEIDPTVLLDLARSGDTQAMSRLLDHYRPYLAMLARVSASRRLQAKYDDSDLVQETLAVVQRDLPRFQGTTEAELTAWLRAIMASVSGKFVRHYTRQRRDASLERRIEDEFCQSSVAVGRVLSGPDSTPSEKTIKRERAVILSRALSELPADYREALILHRLEGLTMAQTAEKMGRSSDSVQKLLARGLLDLRRRLKGRL
jgi:RNA polymerase sigma-70 factor (ECF subfamily)